MEDSRSIKIFKFLQSCKDTEEEFNQIIETCKKNHTKYVDPDFYPQIEVSKDDKTYLEMATWKRVEEEYDPNFLKDIDPDMIGQGILGDCYFVAALIYLAHYPDLVKAMFHPKSDLSLGVVMVYFHVLGEKMPVIIDTQLPFDADSPIFSHPRVANHNPAWFALIEKAFAKASGGYFVIEAGQSHVAVNYLMGWYGDMIGDIQKQVKLGDLFESLMSMKNQNAMLGSSVSMSRFAPDCSPEDVKEDLGLITGHAYQILEVKTAGGLKFMKLRNPWGRYEWKGDYSDKSDKWTPTLKKQLEYENSDDGSFWMLYDDFIKYFSELSYSLPENKNWNVKSVCGVIDGYLDKRSPCGGTKGAGCLPQWSVKFTKPTEVRIHAEIASPNTFHGLNLVYNKGEKVQSVSTEQKSNRDSNNSQVNGFVYYIEDVEYPWTIFLDRTEGASSPSYFRIVIESPDNFQLTKFNDDFENKCSGGIGMFSPSQNDGWDPYGDKAITPCRQWYFRFSEPSTLCLKIYKTISQSPHHLLIGYTDEKINMAYTSIEPRHFNLPAHTDYEEIYLNITNITKPCVICIYREKGNDTSKYKFIGYSNNKFDFGEILDDDSPVPQIDDTFTNITPVPQPENFSPHSYQEHTSIPVTEKQSKNSQEQQGGKDSKKEEDEKSRSKCCILL